MHYVPCLRGKLAQAALMLLAFAAASICLPTASAIAQTPDTLVWAPGGGTGSDGPGTWNTVQNNWFDQTSSNLSPWPGNSATATTYANAIIGSGGVINGTTGFTISVTTPINVGNLTFGAMGTGSLDYDLVDSSTVGNSTTSNTAGAPVNPLILNNVNSSTVGVTDLISNTTSNITDIENNLVAPSNFTLRVSGTGSMAFGGSIGVSTGSNTGSGTLTVGPAGKPYSGTLFLGGSNNITSTTISSGTVAITNNGSLGGGAVTLAGGTLNIFTGAIGLNMAGDQSAGSYPSMQVSSGVSIGAYATANWNNFAVNRSVTTGGQDPFAETNYGTLLTDNAGTPTQASVKSIADRSTFSAQTALPGGLNGTQTMLYGGINAGDSVPVDNAAVTIQNIPYASYSVYAYVYNNGVTAGSAPSLALADSTAGNSTFFFKMVGGTTPSTVLQQITSTVSGSPTTQATSSSLDDGMYALWTNQTGSTATVTLADSGTSGTPWIAGVEIVASPISISQVVNVTASSTIDIGSYVAAPTLTGGLSISPSTTLSFANPSGAGGNIQVPGAITFNGAGGVLNIGTSTSVTSNSITDGSNGYGFSTTGTGTLQVTADTQPTLTGQVNIATTVQGSVTTTGSPGTGPGSSALGTGPLVVQSGGSIFGTIGLGNSSITINSGGMISGIQGNGNSNQTGMYSSTIIDNGTIAAGIGNSGTVVVGVSGGTVTVNGGGIVKTSVGAINLVGNTTVGSGSSGSLFLNLNGSTGETLTASGTLTLAGGNSVFSLFGGSTSGLINVPSTNGLSITGTHEIDAYTPSGPMGVIPSTPGQSSTFDLINYAGTLLNTSGGAESPLMFTDPSQGGELTFGPGSTPGTGQIVIPPSYLYQFTNFSTGPSENEIALILTAPAPLTWAGSVNSGPANTGSWDKGTTQNWAANIGSSFNAATYQDGETVTFADQNPLTNANVANFIVNIVPSSVLPGSVTFTNTGTAHGGVNYTFTGNAIGGTTGITLSGTGGVGGTVTFTEPNSFNGAIAINAGELIAANATALGNASGTTVASGAALQLSGGFTYAATGTSTLPLTLSGAGYASSPAGALDSEGGNNAYPGAITLGSAATINSGTTSDTLALSGGIATTTNDLAFTGTGNITIATKGITSTDTGATAIKYNGTGTLTFGIANTIAGGIALNSGTLLQTAAGGLGASTGLTIANGASATYSLQGGISTGAAVPLNFAAGGSPGGTLRSVSGANTFAGAVNLLGNGTITSSSVTTGDSLTLSGAVNLNSNTLTFNGPGNMNVTGSVSGTGGSVVYSGTGTLNLSNTNSFTGGTTVNSGVVRSSVNSLGSGALNLTGGTFGMYGANGTGIGMNVATNGTAGLYNLISPASTVAGVVPIANWNNLMIQHGTAPIAYSNLPGSGDTTLPLALVDGNGNATTAVVASWIGSNGFSTTNTANTGVTELFSSGLNANSASGDPNPSTITLSGIPYLSYTAYVYFWNNNSATVGTEQAATGSLSSALSTNSLKYFFSTGGTTPTSYVVAGTTSGTQVTGADYGVWSGLTGSNFEAINTETSGGTPWIAGIEIVPQTATVNNPVNVTSTSTIDVTSIYALTMGNLTMSNSSTLNVTGGSVGNGTPYSLTLGTLTLNSNANFNVANNSNGSGTGTLNLGAISDGANGYSVTLNGPGVVGLTSPTGNVYSGGTFVTAGTLQLYDMGSNSFDSATGSAAVVVSGTGALAGPTNAGGNSYVAGAVSVGAGAAISGSTGASMHLQKGLTLANGSAIGVAFNGSAPGGTGVPAIIVTSGASPTSVSIGTGSGTPIDVNLSGTPYAINGTAAGLTQTINLLSYTGTALSASGSGSSTLTFGNGASMTVISGANTPPGPFSNFALVNNPGNSQIDLTYTVWAESWTGDSNAKWSTTSSDVNWAVGVSGSGTGVSFINTANVIFGDKDLTNGANVANSNVTIQAGGVQPSSVVFTNTAAGIGQYSFVNATNALTGTDDTSGISGSTGLTFNGDGGVRLTDGNTFTGAIQVNNGYLAIDTTVIPAANQSSQINGLGNSSGVTVSAGGELQLASSAEAGNSYTYGATANGSGAIPLNISGPGFPGMPNGNVGALSSAGGVVTYAGPITLGGNATVNSNSTSTTDQLLLIGGVNTNGNVLTFNGPGGTTVASSITGSGGSIANTGGIATLSGNNSFTGGVNINGGAVAVASNSALGSGAVTLDGGALDFVQGSAISLNIAASGTTASTGVGSLLASQSAGVTPALAGSYVSSVNYNWNNLTVIHPSATTPIGSPAPQGGSLPPTGSTLTPLALTDSTGGASGASVTSYSGGSTSSVPGNGNATLQMLSSWLGTTNYPQANVTISNIPYSQYAVYLYFYNSAASYGHASISSSSTSYYFSTFTNGHTPATLTAAQATTNPGVTTSTGPAGYQLADYAVWTGQTASTLTATIAAAEVGGNGSPGLAGIQIVNEAPVYTNSVNVTTDSSIDLTGVSSVTVGPLSIGSNTLSVTGGSISPTDSYSLKFGATTISGSPDFNVANNTNGSGVGTLRLGAITDSGSGDNVTINGNGGQGVVVFTAGDNYTGSTTVNAGTLRLIGALASNGGVMVNSGATLSGPTTVGNTASIAGAVNSSGTIAGTDGAQLSLTGGLTINGGSGNFTLSGGAPSGAAIIVTSGATPSLNIAGFQSINVSGLPDAAPGSHVYDLYSYTGGALSPTGNGTSTLTYSGGSLSLGSTVSGPFAYSLNDTGSQVDLNVTAYALTWNGPGSGTWDTTSVNWQYATPSVLSTNYVDGATVNFGDNNLSSSQVSSNAGLVTITAQSTGVNPGAMAFTNVGSANGGVDYLINGGAIGGASTTLSKSGAGVVTLNDYNTYGGGTTISAGTLVAGTTSALGTGDVTLSGGTLRLGTSVNGFGGNGPTTITGASGTANGWTVTSDTITTGPFTATNVLQLTTNVANQTRNAFLDTRVPVGNNTLGFTAQYVYQATTATANGAVFILQNSTSGAAAAAFPASSAGSGATGGNGLGFSGIFPSVGFEMNVLSSQTGGVAWEANGVTNGTVGTPFTPVTGINLASGDPILVTLSYTPSNTTLTATLTDQKTGVTGTYTNNLINVGNVLGDTSAYVGFGATTGGSTASQSISNFAYAVGGSYANNVSLTGGTSSTIDVAANAAISAESIGTLTFGSGLNTTLSVTAATATSGQSYSLTTGAVTLNSNAAINVANVGTGVGTLNLGAVSGTGFGLTVNGPGVVSLNNGGNYTGATSVTGGTLRVNGTLSGTSSLTVQSGGTLSGPLSGGSGTVALSPAIQSGGMIAANNGGSFNLTAGLTLPAGTLSLFNVSGTPNGTASGIGLVATSGSSPQSLNLTGSNMISFTGVPSLGLSTETFDLFSYTGTPLQSSGPSSGTTLAFTNATGTFAVSSSQPVAPFFYTLVNNPNATSGGQIDVTVGEYTFTWTGANGAPWDTSTVNWSVPTAPTPTATAYFSGAAAIFADNSPLTNTLVPNTSGMATVTIQASGIQPLTVTFTNVGAAHGGVDYAVGGGPISGIGAVTLNGTGNVTLSGSNTFTGGVAINAGALIVASDATAAGAAAPLGAVPTTATPNNIVINGGALQDGAASGVTLVINANRGIGLGSNIGGSGTINVPTGGTTLYQGSIANAGSGAASLVVNGAGVLTLTGSSSYSGGTTVSNGTLVVAQSSNALGSGPVTLSGGTLSLAGIGTSGLAGTYFQSSAGAGTWFTTSGASDTNLGDNAGDVPTALSGVISYFNSVSPVVKAPTTTGGLTTLTFPAASGGNAFASQGFSGTADYEALLAGELFITQPGSYTFSTASDDGSTLFIDGTQVVNNNKNHGVTTITSSAVALTAGLHQIDVGYFQGISSAQLTVNYSGPDTSNTSVAIPDSVLFSPNATQSYSNNFAVTSNSSINVGGSLLASMGGLSLTGSTLSVGSTDATGTAYSLSFTGVTASGTARVNVAASSSSGAGTVVSTGPANMATNASLTVGSGTLAFNVNSGTGSIGSGSSVAVNSGAVLQLAGTMSALFDGTNAANISNNGSLTVVGASTQQVGIVSGTSSTDVNGATVYAGTTTAGDGTNAATLTASQILQNSLVIGANSTVAIIPSTGSGPGVASSSSVASDSSAAVAGSSSSDSASTGDAFAGIEAALASSTSSHDALDQLRSLVSSDPGLKLTPGDDVFLYHNYQLAANGVSLAAANSGAAATPTLVSDLTADGLTPSEISSLVGSAADPATVTLGSSAASLGSISVASPSLAIVGSSTAPVPEPSTLILAALGLGALGLKLRRRMAA